MRPVAEVVADLEMPAPALDADAWAVFCDRATPAEIYDAMHMRPWLELCAEHRAGRPLVVPAAIERDPRFTSVERFVLAALADIAHDADTTKAEAFGAICSRIFGPGHDEVDRRHASAAVERLVAIGALARTAQGGLHRRNG